MAAAMALATIPEDPGSHVSLGTHVSVSVSVEEDDADIPWECIDELVRGAPLLKFGRQGEPHFRFFRLEQDCQDLSWQTHKKASAESRVVLTHCRVIEGQQTDVFKRQPRPDLVDLSFSLEYGDPKRRGKLRTLDVICKDRREYDAWTTALRYLTGGAPPAALVAARAATVWAQYTLDEDVGEGVAERVKMIKRDLKKRIKDTNDVYAFGQSPWGQLGMDDEAVHALPTIVPALLGKAVRTVSCGSSHAIVLTEAGEAYAMGHGGSGRLGTGSVEHELLPRLLLRPAAPGSGHAREPYRFRAVACGDMHTVAIGVDGLAYAWGCGYHGATGLGADPDLGGMDMLWPTKVPAFAFVMAADSGGRAAALSDASPAGLDVAQVHGVAEVEGRVLTTRVSEDAESLPSYSGSADMPRTFLTAEEISRLRVSVRTEVQLAAVAAGSSYSAFVDTEGRLFTCGISDAPLGIPKRTLEAVLEAQPKPRTHELATGIAETSVLGALHAYASGGDSALQTQQLPSDLHVPLQVFLGSDFARERVVGVSCGEFHMGAATANGTAYTCGWNSSGALGLGDTEDRAQFSRVWALPKSVIAIACGGAHTLALVEHRGVRTERTVYAFGSAACGQVPREVHVSEDIPEDAPMWSPGQPPPSTMIVALPRPVALPVSTQEDDGATGERPCPLPASIAAGLMHSAVITSDGSLFLFGDGTTGALGITQGAMPDIWKRVRRTRLSAAASNIGRAKSLGDRLRSFGGIRSASPVPLRRTASDESGDASAPLLPPASPAFRVPDSRGVSVPRHATERTTPPGHRVSLSAPAIPARGSSTPDNLVDRTGPRAADSLRDSLVDDEAMLNIDMRPRSVVKAAVYFADTSAPGSGSSRVPMFQTASSDHARWIIPGYLPAIACADDDAKEAEDGDGLDYSDEEDSDAGEHVAQDLRERSQIDIAAPLAVSSLDSDDRPHRASGADAVESTLAASGTASPGIAPSTMGGSHARASRSTLASPAARKAPPVRVPERALDIRRPPSPTRVREYAASHTLASAPLQHATSSSPPTMRAQSSFMPNRLTRKRVSTVPGYTPQRNERVVDAPAEARRADAAAPAPPADAAAALGPTSSVTPSESASAMHTEPPPAELPHDAPIQNTVLVGPLPVLALMKKEVRSVACGLGFTICTTATEWMHNDEAEYCMRCALPFTLSRRRHHCRNCGGIFCDKCSGNKLPLLKLGYIEPVRVCDGCYTRLIQE